MPSDLHPHIVTSASSRIDLSRIISIDRDRHYIRLEWKWEKKMAHSDARNTPSANDTAPALRRLPLLSTPTASLAMVRIRRHALAHQHACARCSLEYIVYTLDLQRRALFVRPRPNRLCDALSLFSTHVLRVVRRAWSELRC